MRAKRFPKHRRHRLDRCRGRCVGRSKGHLPQMTERRAPHLGSRQLEPNGSQIVQTGEPFFETVAGLGSGGRFLFLGC